MYVWNSPSAIAENRTPRSDAKSAMPSERQYITQSPPTSHLSLSATAVSPVTATGCAMSKKSICLHSSRPSTFATTSFTRPKAGDEAESPNATYPATGASASAATTVASLPFIWNSM